MSDDQGSKEEHGEHVESREQKAAFSLLSILEGEGQGGLCNVVQGLDMAWLGVVRTTAE